MIKRLQNNISMVLGIIALIGFVSVGYGYTEQVKKNTEHRYFQEYGQLMDWIKAEERECGEDGEECGQRRQKMIQGWKFRINILNEKLGFKEVE